ncbi:murein L,D-transpeptidase catalytic domain-containing protein [Flavobacterium sp.]|uniref:murein L,D-transpeptidase catalytic domain-containing protein n=1 Tax=Flavobacterium sp. TaxID=239 RepID=UPI0026252B7D|nr:murein L,D-transpeptidase catalytic domain family protein [Flavobacterium sp.]
MNKPKPVKGIVFFLAIFLMQCVKKEQSEPIQGKASYSTYHQEALSFCQKKGMSTHFYYLLDLRIPSGKNRFFVYDFAKDSVTYTQLVTHGSCDIFTPNPQQWEKAQFDTRVNSHCSMLGKYKIGRRDTSSWGIKIKYWLHGLESSNATAVERVVVLHSWNAVSDAEIHPEVSPLSWGCPAVSNNFMRILDAQLQGESKSVLLWIIGN